MTVGELKEMLDDLERVPPEGASAEDVNEMEVMCEYNFGDHCCTRALARPEVVQVIGPIASAYSDTGLAVGASADGDEYGRDRRKVVALLDEAV